MSEKIHRVPVGYSIPTYNQTDLEDLSERIAENRRITLNPPTLTTQEAGVIFIQRTTPYFDKRTKNTGRFRPNEVAISYGRHLLTYRTIELLEEIETPKDLAKAAQEDCRLEPGLAEEVHFVTANMHTHVIFAGLLTRTNTTYRHEETIFAMPEPLPFIDRHAPPEEIERIQRLTLEQLEKYFLN